MKGKKKNFEFINSFLKESIDMGISDSDDILLRAKNSISIIDSKLKEIDKLKIMRSNLSDILDIFDNKSISKEIKYLDYLKLSKSNKDLCYQLKLNPIKFSDYLDNLDDLIRLNLITVFNGYIFKGKEYDLFAKEMRF